MVSSFRTRQAGEGKVGCFSTLAVVGILVAIAIKAGPVYYSNNEFKKALADDIGPSASRANSSMSAEDLADTITKAARLKAKELDIPEAQKEGAIRIVVQQAGGDTPGNVHFVLHYSRPVDFYGVYSYTFETDETFDVTLMTNIK